MMRLVFTCSCGATLEAVYDPTKRAPYGQSWTEHSEARDAIDKFRRAHKDCAKRAVAGTVVHTHSAGDGER